MTPGDVIGWMDRNPLFEPSHDEAALLVDEIARLRRQLADTEAQAKRLLEQLEDRDRHASILGPCNCRVKCWDVMDEIGVCKGLPPMPEPPLVEITTVHRGY